MIRIEQSSEALEKSARAQARTTLTKMLLALSDEALEYVWRPIVYAYYYTDQRDPDRLTDDDSKRLGLIGAVAHEPPDVIDRLNQVKIALWHAKRNAERGKAVMKSNIEKLTDYINQQEDPERFMEALFALIGPKKKVAE